MARKEKSENCQRVSVADAAREIGCDPQYLKLKMKKKKWDLGVVELPVNGGRRCNYIIFRRKLDKFLGLDIDLSEREEMA